MVLKAVALLLYFFPSMLQFFFNKISRLLICCFLFSILPHSQARSHSLRHTLSFPSSSLCIAARRQTSYKYLFFLLCILLHNPVSLLPFFHTSVMYIILSLYTFISIYCLGSGIIFSHTFLSMNFSL